MSYKLLQVKYEKAFNGSETFTLYYQKGNDEAHVSVTKAASRIKAQCEELPADSHMDEMVLETVSETWVGEHAGAFGDIGTV